MAREQLIVGLEQEKLADRKSRPVVFNDLRHWLRKAQRRLELRLHLENRIKRFP